LPKDAFQFEFDDSMTPIALLILPDFVIIDRVNPADRSAGFFSLANGELVGYHTPVRVNAGWA
jgi:hypothetical protein